MKLWKKLTMAALSGLLVFGPVASAAPANTIVAQAAETYTCKTDKNNQVFKGKKGKIDAFMGEPSGAISSAKSDCKYCTSDDTYCDYVTQKVTFLSDDIISIRTTSEWYAGGVRNTNVFGYTFNLKTGKELNKLTSVTKTSSLSKIKRTLSKKITDQGFDASDLEKMEEDDFHYYLNPDGKVIVCFGPYELGYGGWTKKYTLSGKYQK